MGPLRFIPVWGSLGEGFYPAGGIFSTPSTSDVSLSQLSRPMTSGRHTFVELGRPRKQQPTITQCFFYVLSRILVSETNTYAPKRSRRRPKVLQEAQATPKRSRGHPKGAQEQHFARICPSSPKNAPKRLPKSSKNQRFLEVADVPQV